MSSAIRAQKAWTGNRSTTRNSSHQLRCEPDGTEIGTCGLWWASGPSCVSTGVCVGEVGAGGPLWRHAVGCRSGTYSPCSFAQSGISGRHPLGHKSRRPGGRPQQVPCHCSSCAVQARNTPQPTLGVSARACWRGLPRPLSQRPGCPP